MLRYHRLDGESPPERITKKLEKSTDKLAGAFGGFKRLDEFVKVLLTVIARNKVTKQSQTFQAVESIQIASLRSQ